MRDKFAFKSENYISFQRKIFWRWWKPDNTFYYLFPFIRISYTLHNTRLINRNKQKDSYLGFLACLGKCRDFSLRHLQLSLWFLILTLWFSSLFFQSEHRPNLIRHFQIVYGTLHQESIKFTTIRKLFNSTFNNVRNDLTYVIRRWTLKRNVLLHSLHDFS